MKRWRNREWIQDCRKLGMHCKGISTGERAVRTGKGLLGKDWKKAPEINQWLKKKAISGSLSVSFTLFPSCPMPTGVLS